MAVQRADEQASPAAFEPEQIGSWWPISDVRARLRSTERDR